MTAVGPVSGRVLLGSDHTQLGAVAVEEISPWIAIGLSRGRFPKGYPHLDPNEDGVIAATDGRAAVMAVADGHNGFDAARTALLSIGHEVPDLLEAPGSGAELALRGCFQRVADQIDHRLKGIGGRGADSGTTLTAAIVSSSAVSVLGLGDSVCVVIRGSRVRRVGGDAPYLRRGATAAAAVGGRWKLRSGDLVMLATDGLIDFLGQRWRRRIADLATDATPAELVLRSIEAACAGGAGDNIAVAVAAV